MCKEFAVNAVGVNERSFPHRVTGVTACCGRSKTLEGFCGTIPSATDIIEDTQGVSSVLFVAVWRFKQPEGHF